MSCSSTSPDPASIAERKALLTPLEYRVTQEKATERPFSNRYNRHWERGSYHCVLCDTELFKSESKFESKSGWPAFDNVVDEGRVKLKPDLSHVGANILLLVSRPDLARTEVSCSICNAHLGHLFKDGPKPTGLRYCINSNSLNFVPTDMTQEEVDHQTTTATPQPLAVNNDNKKYGHLSSSSGKDVMDKKQIRVVPAQSPCGGGGGGGGCTRNEFFEGNRPEGKICLFTAKPPNPPPVMKNPAPKPPLMKKPAPKPPSNNINNNTPPPPSSRFPTFTTGNVSQTISAFQQKTGQMTEVVTRRPSVGILRETSL